MVAAWDLNPDVHEFSEAVTWFQRRTVLTAEDALKLNERARNAAFWVGGGLQLQQVQDVFQALDKSISKGEKFEEFRARLKTDLKPAHASIVFRNATQRAYNAGRYEQMTQPDVLKFRPFWMYDSVLDSRTTFICKQYNKTLLLADDPWWQTRIPPNHHGCRASIRSLRRAEAERRGISLNPAVEQPGQGWAVHPLSPLGPPEGKDPRLVAELTKKTVEPVRLIGPGSVKSDSKTPIEHDPAHWIPRYSKRYGEAAKSIGWGRAMSERGLDTNFGEFLDDWKEFGIPNPVIDYFALRGDKTKLTIRELGGEINPLLQAPATLVAHSGAIRKRALAEFPLIGHAETRLRAEVAVFRKRASLLIDERVLQPTRHTWIVEPGDDPEFRAGFQPKNKRILVNNSTNNVTMLHEWSHGVETLNPALLERSLAFLDSRQGTEQFRLLRTIPGYGRYKTNELAFEDALRDAYTSTLYLKDGVRRGSEVTSQGADWLLSRHHLAMKDWEHFWLTLGQYSGQ